MSLYTDTPIRPTVKLCICKNISESTFFNMVQSGLDFRGIISSTELGTQCGTCLSEAASIYRKFSGTFPDLD